MKLLLLGDVCPTQETSLLFHNVQVDELFGDVRSLFETSDFSFVNLECTLTESNNEIKKFGPVLRAPKNTARTLKELGVDCCGLSNNHIFDCGIEGVRDTLKALDTVGLQYTGFGADYNDSRRDYIIDRNGERIALIAVCEHEYSYALEDRMGSRPYDVYDTMADIRNAKAQNDKVVVIYHGGKEYCRYPSPRVRKLCRAMVDNGADVVLCQHSHCIATYENYRNAHILHGQGNFNFVKSDVVFDGWHSCLATIYDTLTNEINFVPIVCNQHGVQLAKGDVAELLMAAFESRNQELQNGNWKHGWHSFCEEYSKPYMAAIKNACLENSTEEQNALFAHYLDCEAHTDVWRELFPTYNQTNEK